MRSFTVTDQVRDYAVAHGSWQPDQVLRDLQEETAALGDPAGMQIGSDEGQLLTLLTRMVDASYAVEVGTFTGYSSLCIARGLKPGGTLLCCDVSEEWTSIATKAWERAGVRDRIELRIAPGAETLMALPLERKIDLAFIDADKGGYITYWEALIPRMRPGGVLLADNVLWSGRITETQADGNTADLRAFNDHAASDSRVELVVLPAFDGLTIARKKEVGE